MPSRWPSTLEWAGVLTALTVCAGLAANRHLFDAPTTAPALLTDLLILASVALLAWWVGRWGGLRVASVSALALASFLWVPGWSPDGSEEAPAHPTPSSQGPHVVLLVIDTLRQDVFRSVLDETQAGREFQQALGPAAYFDQAIAAAPWTVPSMASILTGLYPQEHGHGRRHEASGRFLRLADSVPTLAESFRDAGYRTEALVTNPWLYAGSGIDQGFQHFEDLECAEGLLPTLILARRLGFLRYRIY